MTRRRPLLLAVAATAVLLAGCGSADRVDAESSPDSASTSAQPAQPYREPLRYSDPVAQPKDASDVEACDLLTDGQLEDLGLVPDSAEQQEIENIQTCIWSSVVYPANPVSVQKKIETGVPVLDGLYLIREGTFLYEEREISGHPAVRAEISETKTCTIMVAVSDYQGLGIKADQPLPDPCTTSTRIAELVLSNLPPLVEE